MEGESFTSLVVDDDRATCRIVADVLAAAGHTVTTAGGADEALGLLRERPVDLVVTDWHMPEKDGLSLAGELRALPDGGPGVILLTADGGGIGVAALEAGCDDVVLKPVNAEDLSVRAARVIAERRRERELVRERRRHDRERSARRDAESVTEQTMARVRALLAEQRRLGALHESLLASAGSGIFGQDLDGRITFVNEAACAALGYEREELIGAHMHSLVHHTRPDGSPFPDEECPIGVAAREGTEARVESDHFFTRSGDRLDVEYRVTPVREEGRISGAVVIFEDIGERNAAAERIREQNDQLIEQQQELEAQNEQLSDQQQELEAQNEQLQAQQANLEERAEQLADQRAELQRLYDRAAAENVRLERLYGVARSLAGDDGEPGSHAEETLRRLVESSEAAVGALYTRLEDDAEPALVAVAGIARDGLPGTLRPGHGLAGRALVEATPIGAAHGEGDLRVLAFGKEVDLRHELHLPLRVGADVVGVASFGWTDPGAVDEGHAHMLEALCAQAAAGLARAASERATYEREAVIRTVLDATPDSIMLLGPSGRVRVVNAAAREFFRDLDLDVDGADDEELSAALAGLTRDPAAFRAADVVTGARSVSEFELVDSGRCFRRYVAPVRDETGTSLGRIVVGREVTDERRAERMKDEIVATVSHELRTPLTSIIGYIELLDEEVGERLSEEERQLVRVVDRNARRLLALVGDLLVAAQAEARELDIMRQDCDIAAVAGACVEDARPTARERGVELTFEASGPAVLSGDADRLGQAVANLLGNALKFTPSGGHVAVRVSVTGDSAVVEVEDDGPGIEPQEVDRLFERFYRGASAAAVETPGSGLGLSVTRAVVDAHDGDVAVDTEVGRGTRMIMTLPLKADHQE